MNLSSPNRVRGASSWVYGLRLRDGGAVVFSVARDDGATIEGIRGSVYRTTRLARMMGERELLGYQHAALVAIREFEAAEFYVHETMAWQIGSTANVSHYSRLHIWRRDGCGALCGAKGNWAVGNFGHGHSGRCRRCFAIAEARGLRIVTDDEG